MTKVNNKRIQLTWPRVKDESIKYYKVYRSTKPDVKRSDVLVMEVEHKVLPEPIPVLQEKLTRVDETTYRTRYKNLMPHQDEYPTKIYLNGVQLEDLNIGYGVSLEDGHVYLEKVILENDELTADYYVDGIRVYDTDELEQEGVKYHGPTARDRTENTIPSNLHILPKADSGAVHLKWKDSDTKGQDFHYRVESVDAKGNFSVLSVEAKAFLREGLATESYIIERSYDEGATWQVVATTTAPEYYEYGIDSNPPFAPTEFAGKVDLKLSTGKGNVELTWKASNLGIASVTGKYRVRSQSVLGVVSSPSDAIGPIYLTSNLLKYVLRRKVYDGSYPSYDGNDAVTIGVMDKDTLSFTDYGVSDETVYAYSLYAVDAAGNVSVAATVVVPLGDASPPAKITGIKASYHDYIIYPGDVPPPPVTGVRVSRHSYVLAERDIVAPYPVTQVKVSSYFVGI